MKEKGAAKPLSRRERFIKALNRQEPDRVPIDLGSVGGGITDVAYHRVKEYLGIEGDEGTSYTTTLTVSHFRAGFLKRALPASLLASMDGFFQPTGAWFQLTPSVFVKAKSFGGTQREIPLEPMSFFKCPACGHSPLDERDGRPACPSCGKQWRFKDGIYDFREAAE